MRYAKRRVDDRYGLATRRGPRPRRPSGYAAAGRMSPRVTRKMARSTGAARPRPPRGPATVDGATCPPRARAWQRPPPLPIPFPVPVREHAARPCRRGRDVQNDSSSACTTRGCSRRCRPRCRPSRRWRCSATGRQARACTAAWSRRQALHGRAAGVHAPAWLRGQVPGQPPPPRSWCCGLNSVWHWSMR